MAAKLEVSIFYNEEIAQCEVTWSADRTADFSPMERDTLEQLKHALMTQLGSGVHSGQLH
ncbi:hypothetical protein [Xenorhabdus szentirmaii]|nr:MULTISPECIES: hypothetical protein [Xenorhabdus]MBD2822800.1 hypothetical protein [Xenorhabdus sp. 42]PHM32093.1 hypothetical protein Xsze_02823 [Xenorhabdus szentirmaii DSM 16338]PHM41614.1 hypothetical protein Xszus_01307 [Xenorhabdus szentirmaii]